MKFFLVFLMPLLASIAEARELKVDKAAGEKPVTIIEPHMSRDVTYVGRPFNEILEELFGSTWRQKEEILLTCADGYQSSIPVDKFLAHKAWLVWGRSDKASFELVNNLQGGEIVKLGPYYLVWENQHDTVIREGGATDFPYQVVSVDLISFKERFPKLAPDAGAPSEVREGFKLYRTYCMSCHAIDGEGGKKAPDLGKMGLFTRLKVKKLKAWILDPAKLKPGTAMPAFAPNASGRVAQADKIIKYLNSKIAP